MEKKNIDNERFIHSPRGKVNHFRSGRLSFGNAAEIAEWIFHNIPFPGADASVVKRSGRTFIERGQMNVPHYAAYFGMKSFFNFVGLLVVGTVFGFLAKFSFGRSLLLKVSWDVTAWVCERSQLSRI